MTRHYDVAVLGGRLGAVATAALLARKSLRVLWIDQGEAESAETPFLSGYSPLPDGSAVWSQIISELALAEEFSLRGQLVPIFAQWVLRDLRVDLFSAPAQQDAELARALGCDPLVLQQFRERLSAMEKEVELFLDAAKTLPPSGFFAGRGARAALKRAPVVSQKLTETGLLDGLPSPLTHALVNLLPHFTHVDADDATVGRAARPLGRFLRGCWRLDGDKTLRSLILSRAEQKSFERISSAIESVATNKKQITLSVAGQRDRFVVSALVDASADLAGMAAIEPSLQPKPLIQTLRNAKPRGFLFSLGIQVDRAVVPPGMAEHVLLVDGREQARGDEPADRPLWITTLPGDEDRVRWVIQHPVSAVEAHSRGLERLEGGILARLGRLVPFLSDGKPELSVLSVPQMGRPGGALHPLYAPSDTWAGITGVPMEVGFPHVFLAGPAVLPGLGLEGELKSALQATGLVTALLSKRN